MLYRRSPWCAPPCSERCRCGMGRTVFWEERANPFTCIKWTTPSTASWNSFMLCFTRLMWVSVHIARSSAYMVSTTFPFNAVSTSWTMMLNYRGTVTDPCGTPILTPLVVDVSPFHLTCIDLSLKKDLMVLYMLPEIPILSSFCSSLTCQTWS